MAVSKNHSFLDHCLLQFDQALRTCVPGSSLATRPSPADPVAEEELSAAEKKHIIGLMRINHTGEVCAQALYAGQAATARLDEVRTEDQVCKHLEDHLTKLPEQDGKSKAILEQMIKDERQHGETAKEAGGADLPLPVKQAMASMAQVMKKTTYHI